jgi:hypothetical protein
MKQSYRDESESKGMSMPDFKNGTCTFVAALVCSTLLAAPANAAVKHKLRRSSTHSSLHHTDTPAIAAERATEIQGALIRKGYLSGEPTGTWDAATIAAMQKLQADNGWQSKITPDARALNKLGLGSSPAATESAAPHQD